METSQIIIIAVVILVVLALIVFWPFGKSPTKSSNTYVPAQTNVSGPSAPASVSFYAVNVQYVYSGPPNKNGVSCNYNSYTYVDGQSATLNGTQPFNLQYAISSSQCPMTIVSANVSTPGFQMNSVVPDLPFTLPPNSNAQFQFNMRAPATDFYGPLTISIHYN